MNRLLLLKAVKNQEMTIDCAAEQAQTSRRGLALTLRRYGRHLDYLLKQCDLLEKAVTKEEQMTVKQQIADRLAIKVNQVNRLLRHMEVGTPTPKMAQIRQEKRKNAENRRNKIKNTIKMLAKGSVSRETAEQALDLSYRQVTRYLADLIAPTGLSVKEWNDLPAAQKKRWIDGL